MIAESGAASTLCARLVGGLRPAPTHAGAEALELFSDDLLQHVAIERQIRHELLQLAVLLAQLPQLSQFTQTYPAVLSLPGVKCLLANPELPADLRRFFSTFRLPQRLQNLLFCMTPPRHFL